jgi:ribonuclease HI
MVIASAFKQNCLSGIFPYTVPDETELDKLLIRTMSSGKDEATKSLRIFGGVFIDTPPVKVTIHGASKKAGKHTASAGAGIHFGINLPHNLAARVLGNQTNMHADLVALLLASMHSPLRRTLLV